MIINVTQKDLALREVKEQTAELLQDVLVEEHDLVLSGEKFDVEYYAGKVMAFCQVLEIIDDCMGYSGGMPLEVPNQSEVRDE